MNSTTRTIILERAHDMLRLRLRSRGRPISWPEPLDVARSLIRSGGFNVYTLAHREPGDKFIIHGYASTKNIDRYRTIINPGVYKDSLAYWVKHGVVLKNHSSDNFLAVDGGPIGTPLEASIDDEGLWTTWQMADPLHAHDRIAMTRHEFEQGLLPGHSIGFQVYYAEDIEINDEAERGEPKMIFNGGEMIEMSLVPIPANRESLADFAYGLAFSHRAPRARVDERRIHEATEIVGSFRESLREATSGAIVDDARNDVREVRNRIRARPTLHWD